TAGRDSVAADRRRWPRGIARDEDTDDSGRCARGEVRGGGVLAIRRDCDTVTAMTPPAPRVPALLVHGGAGPDPSTDRLTFRPGMTSAAAAGWRVLSDGGRAIDAVEAAVRVLEDDPAFNAGR